VNFAHEARVSNGILQGARSVVPTCSNVVLLSQLQARDGTDLPFKTNVLQVFTD
jgi:hypothetical protein